MAYLQNKLLEFSFFFIVIDTIIIWPSVNNCTYPTISKHHFKSIFPRNQAKISTNNKNSIHSNQTLWLRVNVIFTHYVFNIISIWKVVSGTNGCMVTP